MLNCWLIQNFEFYLTLDIPQTSDIASLQGTLGRVFAALLRYHYYITTNTYLIYSNISAEAMVQTNMLQHAEINSYNYRI